jgi:hypothetical protein
MQMLSTCKYNANPHTPSFFMRFVLAIFLVCYVVWVFFVFVLCLVLNVAYISALFILQCPNIGFL